MVIIDSDNSFPSQMKIKVEPTYGSAQNQLHYQEHHLQHPAPHQAVQQIRRDSISLSDYYSDNEPNDLDFNELAKISQYRQAIEIIKRKCEALSKDNEKLVRRLHHVKKITRRKERDVSLLKTRLDVYSDDWRTAQPETQFKGQMPSLIPATNKIKKTKIRKNDKNAALAAAAAAAAASAAATGPLPSTSTQSPNQPSSFGKLNQTSSTPVATTKGNKNKEPGTKRKRIKSEKEKDPNAPKRPANPFFQFCQEQRSILMDELNSELMPGEPELSKQELTRQLANRWRTMDTDNKQIYINKYENSKQKYNEEMQCYRREGDAAAAGAAVMKVMTTSMTH